MAQAQDLNAGGEAFALWSNSLGVAPVKMHDINGGGGVRLHVREWGSPSGIPILFIHGWSQNHLCWAKQVESPALQGFRLVALDLRGHGMSEAPVASSAYTDGNAWADDIAAIIGTLRLERPILVGWSYGGFIIGDYLRKYGDQLVGGLNLAGGAVILGPDAFGPLIGPGFYEHAPGGCQPDVPTAIAAMRTFLRACTTRPLPNDDFETVLAFNMIVRPDVRASLIQRDVDFTPELRSLKAPLLVSHGREDRLALPAMAELILQNCPTARPSWYEGVGHAPFLEEPERFDRELAAFAQEVRG